MLTRSILTLFYLSVSSGDLPQYHQPGAKGDQVMQAKSDLKEGMQFIVSVKNEFQAGDKIPIVIKVENHGEIDAFAEFGQSVFRVEVKLTDKAGKAVPFTAYGNQVAKRKKAGSSRRDTVKTKGDLDLSIPNLALVYDLTLPGEYAVTVSREIFNANRTFAVTAGPVVFTIK